MPASDGKIKAGRVRKQISILCGTEATHIKKLPDCGVFSFTWMDRPVLSFGQDEEERFLKKVLTWIDRMNRIKDIKTED